MERDVKIIKNSIKCLTCGDVLVSKYRHDFVSCSCPADSDTSVFIDGGTSYFRGGCGKNARFENLSEFEDDEEEFNKMENPGKL